MSSITKPSKKAAPSDNEKKRHCVNIYSDIHTEVAREARLERPDEKVDVSLQVRILLREALDARKQRRT